MIEKNNQEILYYAHAPITPHPYGTPMSAHSLFPNASTTKRQKQHGAADGLFVAVNKTSRTRNLCSTGIF